MAKKPQQNAPVVPDFKDVDSEAVAAAKDLMQGGRIKPLTPPPGVEGKMDKKGTTKYTRWSETMVITAAYRTVTPSGLLDIVIGGKIRQSEVEENTGARVWFHFYKNVSEDVPENHQFMNDNADKGVVSLLLATGFMPNSGTLKASLLNKMFPQKNQPGSASPLVDKTVIVNVVQQEGPQRDRKTKQIVKDAKGNTVIDVRDQADSFLPAEESDDEE